MRIEGLEIPCEMTMTMDKNGIQLHVQSSYLRAMRSLTMGINEAAYYNATHNDIYTGEMEFGDYTCD